MEMIITSYVRLTTKTKSNSEHKDTAKVHKTKESISRKETKLFCDSSENLAIFYRTSQLER